MPSPAAAADLLGQPSLRGRQKYVEARRAVFQPPEPRDYVVGKHSPCLVGDAGKPRRGVARTPAVTFDALLREFVDA